MHVAFANSLGAQGEHEATHSHVSASCFASGTEGERQRAGFGRDEVRFADLGAPEAIGREAARRAVRKIGWRKPPTGPVPVVFAPEVARDFAATLAGALSASAVFRRATFLAESLGEEVASSALGLVDDATLPRRVGSRAFDGEGVRARRTVLFDRGRAASLLADCYSARRTGSRTTGNASRGTRSGPTVATTNLVLEPGPRTPEEIVADVEEGLYVTDLFKFGVNLTAGTWSRGGGGLWISRGKFSHPVQELTVAGELRAMLRGFREAGNDLEWSGGCAAPTVRIDGLTVAAG